jgi:hypothetical protein
VLIIGASVLVLNLGDEVANEVASSDMVGCLFAARCSRQRRFCGVRLQWVAGLLLLFAMMVALRLMTRAWTIWFGHDSKGSYSTTGATDKLFDTALTVSGVSCEVDSSIMVLIKGLLAMIITCCVSVESLWIAASTSNLARTAVMVVP